MNSPRKNSLEVIRNAMRIVDAKIELAEKYRLEIHKIHEAVCLELNALHAGKKSLEETAKTITGQ